MVRGQISSFITRKFQHCSGHSTPLKGELPAAQHCSACLAPRLASGTSCCWRHPTAQALPWLQTAHDSHDAEAPDASTSQPWIQHQANSAGHWLTGFGHRFGALSLAAMESAHEAQCGQQELLRQPKCSLTSGVGRV